MQLKHKFFLILSLLTIVPLLILQFGVVGRMEAEILKRTEIELHVTLDKMSDEITLILQNQKSITRGLAHVPAVRQFASIAAKPIDSPATAEEYQQRADDLEQFFLNYAHVVPSIQALRFIDLQGKTLVKVKEGKPVHPKLVDKKYKRNYVADQSTKNFFVYTSSLNAEVVMSDFELGQVTFDADFCPAMVRYSAQIKDEVENVDGYIVVNMWGTRLDKTIEASLGGYPGTTVIVEINSDESRDGIYLYHRDTPKRFSNQLESDFRFYKDFNLESWNEIKKSDKRGTLRTDDGRLIYYLKLTPFESRPQIKWVLIIEADSETVFAPVKSLRHSIWFLLGVLFVVSLIVSIWAAFRLARPVHHLAEVITNYADGDNNVRYEGSGKDEICLAGEAFNYLTTKMEKAQKEKDKAQQLARQSERLASVGQMAAGIGHEINNPLMNIMSLAGLVEKSLGDDKQSKSDIDLLQTEVKRCSRIVQGILSFARENEPDIKEFDMSILIEETLALLRHRIESDNITVETELADNLLLTGDANQLQQVLVNVILNAVQASAGGTVHIKAHLEVDYVAVEIIDTGTGINDVELNRVFDPFFTTKAEGQGTGLGLSVSYGIVKHHGGTIHVENNVDAGLRVVILLPIKSSNSTELSNDS